LIQLKAPLRASGDHGFYGQPLGPRTNAMNATYSPVQSEVSIVFPFDARGIAKRFRHAAMFAALDVLRPGETMRVVSECDLAPLQEQMRRRYGAAVTSRSVERGPDRVVVDFIRG
jgi:uncharacterized protein (DUF2249 family)